MEGSFGLRKGVWTEEEDVLLRHCIEKYGEGKWHQVPLRAGLNRCRKSCRLRWLNYLRPNIKRGEFAVDEIDLLIRLHKLLGNRWSLIAGRLPGRTANDVKNYWNTHMRKKIINTPKITKVNVIKPQPRTFSKILPWVSGKSTIVENIQGNDNLSKTSPTLMPFENRIDSCEGLLNDKDGDERNMCTISGLDGEPNTHLWIEEIASAANLGDTFLDEGPSDWSDFSFDMSLWDLFGAEQETLTNPSFPCF